MRVEASAGGANLSMRGKGNGEGKGPHIHSPPSLVNENRSAPLLHFQSSPPEPNIRTARFHFTTMSARTGVAGEGGRRVFEHTPHLEIQSGLGEYCAVSVHCPICVFYHSSISFCGIPQHHRVSRARNVTCSSGAIKRFAGGCRQDFLQSTQSWKYSKK